MTMLTLGFFFLSVNSATNKQGHALFTVVVKTLKRPLLIVVIPRLCLIGFMYSQPYLNNRAIKLSVEPVNKQTTNYGYGLIGAYVIVYVGIAVSLPPTLP